MAATQKSTSWPWFPIHSFRQFFARTYRFGTIQNVTDDRWQTTQCTKGTTDSTVGQKSRVWVLVVIVLFHGREYLRFSVLMLLIRWQNENIYVIYTQRFSFGSTEGKKSKWQRHPPLYLTSCYKRLNNCRETHMMHYVIPIIMSTNVDDQSDKLAMVIGQTKLTTLATIDIMQWNKSRVWSTVLYGSTLIFGDTRIFLTHFRISLLLVATMPKKTIWSHSHFDTVLACDRCTDRAIA